MIMIMRMLVQSERKSILSNSWDWGYLMFNIKISIESFRPDFLRLMNKDNSIAAKLVNSAIRIFYVQKLLYLLATLFADYFFQNVPGSAPISHWSSPPFTISLKEIEGLLMALSVACCI